MTTTRLETTRQETTRQETTTHEATVPIVESGEPLVRLSSHLSPTRERVRSSVAHRLVAADADLPRGLRLLIVRGHHSEGSQRGALTAFAVRWLASHPELTVPTGAAPHLSGHSTGAAVDLLVVDQAGRTLEVAADPECIQLVHDVLTNRGFVRSAGEWRHWTYGDRSWSAVTGAPYARYGPVAS